jgi:hypothetical protein
VVAIDPTLVVSLDTAFLDLDDEIGEGLGTDGVSAGSSVDPGVVAGVDVDIVCLTIDAGDAGLGFFEEPKKVPKSQAINNTNIKKIPTNPRRALFRVACRTRERMEARI